MIIYIIEDEPYALEELQRMMEPFMTEHQVIAFETGEDAIESSNQQMAPDLVITDIRMPGMNGLETVKQLKNVNPHLVAVVISGYSEFEYAREGMKIGIKDYLLKPVSEEKLTEMVRRLIAVAESEAEERRNRNEWSLFKHVKGIIPASHSLTGSLCLFTSVLGNWKSKLSWNEYGPSSKEACAWLTNKIGQANISSIETEPHIRVFLIPLTSSVINSELISTFYEFQNYLMQGIDHVHSTIGIRNDNESLDQTYRNTILRLEKRLMYDRSTFTPFEEEYAVTDFTEIWNQVRVLEKAVQQVNMSMIRTSSHSMIKKLAEQGLTSKQMAVLLVDILYAIKFKLPVGELNDDRWKTSDALDASLEYSTSAELAAWLEQKLTSWAEPANVQLAKPKELIPLVLNLVKEQYHQEITLQDFANNFHVSLGHLSKLFKAEMGMNFSEYIIHYRMKKAQQFMDDGVERISDISRMVGYEDPKFFTKTFKRITGMTPMEYQKQKRK